MKRQNTRKFDSLVPSPFSLAILLTFATFIFALVFTGHNIPVLQYVPKLFGFWESGFWGLLKFAMQMMLMLVLGNVLALTKPFERAMAGLGKYATNTARAAFIVAFATILMAYINWGLGLIFGALFARSIAIKAREEGFSLNYPLIGAAAYSGLMIWHGGLSGSAPLKVAEPDHFLVAKMGVISVTDTLFSTMNIVSAVVVIVLIPLLFYFLGKKSKESSDLSIYKSLEEENSGQSDKKPGDGRLEASRWFSFSIALFIIIAIIIKIWHTDISKVLNINFVNLMLFALSLLVYPSIGSFAKAVGKAIGSSAGIMLQFPLYAGIMGLMQYSGLSDLLTHFIIDISTPGTFSLFTMFSAGLVNFFVPSGGGQWAVQGPLIVDAAMQLQVPVSKAVMALAYGDQLTNMIQPFWALPLLAITGLKAKSILPYSFILMILGVLIFGVCLLMF